jgi:hypothetical protein
LDQHVLVIVIKTPATCFSAFCVRLIDFSNFSGSFGDIFARAAGSPADPLILYVHGSGNYTHAHFPSQ